MLGAIDYKHWDCIILKALLHKPIVTRYNNWFHWGSFSIKRQKETNLDMHILRESRYFPLLTSAFNSQ